MRDEYYFAGGVRGKYATRYAQDTNIVLDRDVAEIFPTSRSANDALRALATVIRNRERESVEVAAMYYCAEATPLALECRCRSTTTIVHVVLDPGTFFSCGTVGILWGHPTRKGDLSHTP
jgi:hypothetical protein